MRLQCFTPGKKDKMSEVAVNMATLYWLSKLMPFKVSGSDPSIRVRIPAWTMAGKKGLSDDQASGDSLLLSHKIRWMHFIHTCVIPNNSATSRPDLSGFITMDHYRLLSDYGDV